jgi:hypothetical protein
MDGEGFNELKIVVALRDLRDHDVFVKIRGEKRFVLRTSLTIYRVNKEKETIHPSQGTVFATGADLLTGTAMRDISEMSQDTEVMWITTLEELTFRSDGHELDPQ